MSKLRNNIYRLLIIGIAFAFIGINKSSLRHSQKEISLKVTTEPIYLPETKYVKLVTFGFNNFVSDILWFNTINYFGEHFASDQDYRWFAHMCDLVTELDQNKIEQFEFCATLISWIAKEPTKSVQLLTKAIAAHPNHWRFRYLRGFNNWYFLHERKKAQEDFKIAATLPNAPQPFLASLASRLMVTEDDNPDTAIFFLQDMIKNTSDPIAKKALKEQYKKARMSKQIHVIKRAIRVYEKRLGKTVYQIQDLQESGILIGTPKDPFGGSYYIDKETREIRSTSKQRPLEFYGRTIETGLLKKEFSPGMYQ